MQARLGVNDVKTPSFGAEVIKPLLREKGWTQTTLAAELGVDKSLVNNWIQKGIIPTDENLRQISEVMAIEVERWQVIREFRAFDKQMERRRIRTDKYLQPMW
jgi:transcriptional regulator with XRE-family HTH domain